MTKIIAIAGAQGTGKTYLARGLTNKLNELGKPSEYVSEMAREWIGRFGPPKDVADQLDIFDMQLVKEDLALKNKSLDFLIVDSPVYLPHLYGSLVSKIDDCKEQYRLQKLFSKVIAASGRYKANIILTDKKHKDDDSLRVWNKHVEGVITNGILYFVQGHSLNNIKIISDNLDFEDRVNNLLKFIISL